MIEIRFDDVRRFLIDQALPFWGTTGVYDNGCFVEHLDLSGKPVDPGFTRVRVQARQIFVFSHAQRFGFWSDDGVAKRSLNFFLASAWLGPKGGWAKLIDRHGKVLDASVDLYDTGFALLALAWRYRVVPEQRLLDIAHTTLDFLGSHMRHEQGGYLNDSVGSLPRQQNPHMHLAEAMIAWFEASGDMRFLSEADQLIELLDTKFYEKESGALGEFFTDGLDRVPGPQGGIVEPGHQFEWAWIIGHYGRLSGRPRQLLMRRLIEFAFRTGYDERRGLTVDQVGRDGHIIAASHRLWPQTEALKAALAGAEFLNDEPSVRVSKIVDAIFKYFLDAAPIPGTWLDHYKPDWSLLTNKIPATSLYHIYLAFSELLRLRERL